MPDFMTIDSARLEQAGAGEKTPEPQQPDKDAVQQFHESMETKGKDREGRSGDAPADVPDDDAPGQMPSLPLNDLFSGRMTSITPGEVRPEAPMPPGELAEKLVERILVGQTADGGQEVRLRLGPDVLPGTEIRMTKGPDGILSRTMPRPFRLLSRPKMTSKPDWRGWTIRCASTSPPKAARRTTTAIAVQGVGSPKPMKPDDRTKHA